MTAFVRLLEFNYADFASEAPTWGDAVFLFRVDWEDVPGDPVPPFCFWVDMLHLSALLGLCSTGAGESSPC